MGVQNSFIVLGVLGLFVFKNPFNSYFRVSERKRKIPSPSLAIWFSDSKSEVLGGVGGPGIWRDGDAEGCRLGGNGFRPRF